MSKESAIFLNAEDFPKVPLVIEGISTRFIRENRIIPFEFRNDVMKVLMADPEDRAVIEALRVATAGEVIVYTAAREVIDELLS